MTTFYRTAVDTVDTADTTVVDTVDGAFQQYVVPTEIQEGVTRLHCYSWQSGWGEPSLVNRGLKVSGCTKSKPSCTGVAYFGLSYLPSCWCHLHCCAVPGIIVIFSLRILQHLPFSSCLHVSPSSPPSSGGEGALAPPPGDFLVCNNITRR